jgi:hypothetical protein
MDIKGGKQRLSIGRISHGAREGYRCYVADYRRYLVLRGYGEHLHDWAFVQRGFLLCWLEPGFHRFWQQWNPGIGYFAYRVYLLLGGRKRQNWATVGSFLVNGLVHNLIGSLLVQRWTFPLPFTFLAFGLLAVISRQLDRYVQWNKWPGILHLAINTGLVAASFAFGFRMANGTRLLLTRMECLCC